MSTCNTTMTTCTCLLSMLKCKQKLKNEMKKLILNANKIKKHVLYWQNTLHIYENTLHIYKPIIYSILWHVSIKLQVNLNMLHESCILMPHMPTKLYRMSAYETMCFLFTCVRYLMIMKIYSSITKII